VARYDLETPELRVEGARVAVLAARFNADVVAALLEGALAALADAGIGEDRVAVFRVPGAFELPLAARRAARSGRFDAVIALGAVIRGETPHFEHVARECAHGLARVSLEQDLPVTFGVLTTDDRVQALARAGGDAGNKGAEAVAAALEMVTLLRAIER